MTFCLGIKTKHGIVGLSDTRITSGSETTTSKKVYVVNKKKHSFFVMTSGLRSVRDKAITYFTEVIEQQDDQFNKLYKTVNELGNQIKRVAKEDKKDLDESGLDFNLHAIIGGQLEEDSEPKLYLLYPQGNWIEIRRGTPFVIIGNSGFGNPVLRRSITYEETLDFAIKSAFLAFDATRISANDVDFPIDTVTMENGAFHIHENRFEQNELLHISDFWNSRLKKAVSDLPADILNRALQDSESPIDEF
ncbi:proteasome-type protease [Echinicola vietnamensis]|uniref:Putative proteasome-type protease n=1 Tax=Echinicola vietnamensis (strain DSM 17526 / LMG 23754 / KMM 6221) TaxID=926556 RepID=L0G5T2_ECHVK|nr:proteasome-type protease [Echinicola vietnamensis]AGA80200.1 putative proteasome-type protease [Echinicola vietnamensis DSM 17526]